MQHLMVASLMTNLTLLLVSLFIEGGGGGGREHIYVKKKRKKEPSGLRKIYIVAPYVQNARVHGIFYEFDL